MQKYLSIFPLLLLLLFLGACKKSLPPAQYVQWVNGEKNGLLIKQATDAYEVTLQYRPAEYMALMETRDRVTEKGFASVLSNYSNAAYFALKIKKLNGIGDPLQSQEKGKAEYYSRLRYFSEEIKNDVYLLSEGDTLKCQLSHLERTYKLTPYTNMLLAFDLEEKPKEKNKKLVFIYDDKALGLGKQTFEIEKSALEQIPNIKFN